MAHAEPDKITLFSNAMAGSAYTDGRESVVTTTWKAEPKGITADPPEAVTSATWDAASKTLTLVVAHANGAASVVVGIMIVVVVVVG